MNQFALFYKRIICQRQFYLPVLFFTIIGYSFSIYNRTVSIDGLMGEYTVGSKGTGMLSGRWGMVVWCRILGIMGFDPFVDRFLALVFLTIAALLFCYILYLDKAVTCTLPYTITASIFVTYPLINEIWEYVGADYMVGGNLCLVTMAAITIKTAINNTLYFKRLLIASIFLLLPMSSYETAIFYYIALVEIILFYEYINKSEVQFHFSTWLKRNVFYFVPVIIAFFARFLISYVINSVYNLQYNGGGDTSIVWLGYDFLPTLKGMMLSNTIHYSIYGLVYFPIAVFAVSLLFFSVYILFVKNCNKFVPMFLGMIIVISLFSQAILQGDLLHYRHAQTIMLFVAFSAFLLCSIIKHNWQKSVYIIMFGLCWHQAVYLNRILGLNNLRSDNELTIVRELGMRIMSEYDKKPVVFVGERPTLGNWINGQVSFDKNTWNGRLLYSILDRLAGGHDDHEMPIKYVDTNVNSVMPEYLQLQNLFAYCGYDIEVIPDYMSQKFDKDVEKIRYQANMVAEEKRVGSYQIYDNGDYLIVSLGGNPCYK